MSCALYTSTVDACMHMLELIVDVVVTCVCVLIAAAKHVEPYIWIPQLMDPPERDPVAKKKRKEVRLCVFMKLGEPVHVVELNGTQYEGQQQLKTYTHMDKGEEKQYTTLSGKEYIDCIKSAFAKFYPSRTGRGNPPTLALIHDKCSAHTANEVKHYCSSRRPNPITLAVIPTESPDLSPCDSSFFAVVKRDWHKQTRHQDMTWDEKAKLFVSIVKSCNPDPFLKEMPLRWQACQQERGYHIEAALKGLKVSE